MVSWSSRSRLCLTCQKRDFLTDAPYFDADRNAWDAFRETSKGRDEAFRESGQSRQSICVVAPVFVSLEVRDKCSTLRLACVERHFSSLSQFNGLDKDLFGWQGKGSTGRLLVWKGNGVSDQLENVSFVEPIFCSPPTFFFAFAL